MLQAQSIMSIFPSSVSNLLAHPMIGAIGLAKQFGTAMVDAIQSSIAAASKRMDIAESLGINVQQLAGLDYVARRSGASVESLNQAFLHLPRTIREGLEPIKKDEALSPAQKAVRGLGVDLVELQNTVQSGDFVRVFRVVAEGIGQIKNPIDRTNAAMTLLGARNTELVAAFRGGRGEVDALIERYTRWGAVMDKDTIAAMDRVGDKMGELDFAAEGLKNKFTTLMLPVIEPPLDAVLAKFDASQPQIDSYIEGRVKRLSEVATNIHKWFTDPDARVRWSDMALRDLDLVHLPVPPTPSLPPLPVQLGIIGQDIFDRGRTGDLLELIQDQIKASRLLLPELSAVAAGEPGTEKANRRGTPSGTGDLARPVAAALQEQIVATKGLLGSLGVSIDAGEAQALLNRLQALSGAVGEAQAAMRSVAQILEPQENAGRMRDLAIESAKITTESAGSLKLMIDNTDRVSDRFRALQETARELTDNLAEAASKVVSIPAASSDQTSTQAAKQTFMLALTIPSFDPALVSSEIAKLIEGPLRNALAKQRTAMLTASTAAAIRSGL